MPETKSRSRQGVSAEAGEGRYVIRSGDEVVGQVKSKGHAEMICRARRVTIEMSNQISADSRRHRHRIDNLRKDIRFLLVGLNDLAGVLKRDSRPREVVAAREKVRKLVRLMKSRGYTA